MNKLILFVVLCLAGCASKSPVAIPMISNPTSTKASNTSPASKQTLEKAKETVDIDKELLQPCSKFKSLTVKNPTPNDILKQKADDVAVLSDCAARNRSLIKIIRDAFNIRE